MNFILWFHHEQRWFVGSPMFGTKEWHNKHQSTEAPEPARQKMCSLAFLLVSLIVQLNIISCGKNQQV